MTGKTRKIRLYWEDKKTPAIYGKSILERYRGRNIALFNYQRDILRKLRND
jgi:hypothetical protein